MDTPPPSGRPSQVIWRRIVDTDRQQQRKRRLAGFVVATVVVAALVALLVDPGSALGVVVVAVLIGALWSAYVFGTAVQERTGATITLQGGALVCGANTVPLAEVTTFTTYARKVAHGHGVYVTVRVSSGFTVFRLTDGTTRVFEWQRMPADQIDGVRLALDTVLPGRWQPHDAI